MSEGAEKSIRRNRISLEAITWNSATELSPFGIKVFCVTGGSIPVLIVMPAFLITIESPVMVLLTLVLVMAVFFLHDAEKRNSNKHENATARFVVDGGSFILHKIQIFAGPSGAMLMN